MTGPDAFRVYAVVSAIAPAGLSSMQFIVDRSRFLHMIEPPSEVSPDWNDPAVLEEIGRMVSAHSISDVSGSPHHRH